MQLGMIGLGRMGNGMTKRLEEHGHEVKTYDPQVAVDGEVARRAEASSSTRRATSG